ncbi:MAG: hypothetical protein LIO63_02310, partial [Akkermansia sp.]|nr:hypothetical protein [Akkermansia sp.]
MHSTLYRDLERCIQAATVEGLESAQDGAEQAEEPIGYSTTGWQLERLRAAINGMMRTSMSGEDEEEEPFDCGKIELNADCLRALIEAVNSCDDEENGCTVEVPKEERTSTVHALLYELWKTLGSGVLVNGKRYGGYLTTAYSKAQAGDTLVVCGDNIQPQASGRMEWGKEVTVLGNGTIVNSAERFGKVTAAVTIGGNITLDGLSTYGGFVIDSGGALTLTGNAVLKDCQEDSYGAGIVVNSGGSFTLSGDAMISGCNCTNQNKGGGVTVNQGAAKCDLLGGIITGNSAVHGGGVFVDRAPMNLGGECRIHGNTATSNDGSEGIYVVISDSY